MKRLSPLALASLLLLAGPVFAGGEDKAAPRYELDEIVISADRAPEAVSEVPRNVTVVTAADIAASPGGNVADLVGRESGTAVRSLFGTDKNAVVDLRGMGDSAGSNVVILVDGLRLNAADLSGPDLSAVPASAVDRVEVVRGGASVLYGDGAVGGVVNILTEHGAGPPKASIGASYGSFDSADAWASSDGSVKSLSYAAYAGAHDSDGFRDNSFFRKNDARLRLGYKAPDILDISLSGAFHQDSYGLPGPVSLEESENRSTRTLSHFPSDGGDSEEKHGAAALGFDLSGWGRLELSRSWRFRDVSYVLGYSPLIPRADQTDEINEADRTAEMTWRSGPAIPWGDRLRVQAGAGTLSVDYVRTELSRNLRQNSDTEAWWVWGLARFSVTPKLTLDLGYRRHDYSGRFRTDQNLLYGTERAWQNGGIVEKDWSLDAREAGLTFHPDAATSLFASFSTSFRVPNVDEFAASDSNLSPQHGRHWELGARRRMGETAEVSLTLFDTRIDDEIYYGEDPLTLERVNRNYEDTTVRRGVEAEIRLFPLENLSLWANYTYLTARFEGRDTRVPLVADNKASLGFEWRVMEPLTLAASVTYVGERPDGNDPGNDRYPALPAYTVADAKLSYRKGPLRFYLGVENLTDELYSTVAYSGGCYPMPTRSYSIGGEWDF